MKKRLGKFTLLSCAVLAVCIASSVIYTGIALSLLENPPSSLHSFTVVLIAVIFAAAVILRFFVPMLSDNSDEEEQEENTKGTLNRILSWAAWLFLSLCLSSLVAIPLAGTTDYLGYGAVFAVVSALCITVPCIPMAEDHAMNINTSENKSFREDISALNRASLISLLLSLIPSVGIVSAISCITFSTAMLREEKAPSKNCTNTLFIGIISALICAALTICFISLLFVK